MTVQFVEGHFVETYYPTIESTFNKTIAIGGGSSFNQAEYALEIVDTAGHDEYSLFSTKHAMGIHGYVLVYSITNRQSFELIQLLRDKILNYTGVDWVPIIIVGNKADLHSQRQISKEVRSRQLG